MDLKIRPAEREDAAFMLPLVNAANEGLSLQIWSFLAQPGESSWDVGLRRIQSDDTPVSWRMSWIAEAAGTPVGLVIVHQLSETPEELEATIASPHYRPIVELELLAQDTAYIQAVAVTADMRGQGIGDRLFRFAERFRGPEGTCVIASDVNTGALKYLAQNGYIEAARRPVVKQGWEMPATDWILMRKR